MPRDCSQGKALRLKLYRCPECGTETQAFSDQAEVRCSGRDRKLDMQVVPPCVEWCANASACLQTGYWQTGSG